MRRIAPAFGIVLCLISSACVGNAERFGVHEASLPMHVVLDRSHPWHAAPAQAVGLPVGAVVFVALIPLNLVETALTGKPMVSRFEPTVSYAAATIAGFGTGFVVGFPFFVLGAPFESSAEERREAPPAADAPVPAL